MLARQGRSVVDRLRSGGLPTPKSVHLTLDVASLASSLDPKVLAVEAALGVVNQEAREAQLTLVAKQRAIAEYEATFRAVATTLERAVPLRRVAEAGGAGAAVAAVGRGDGGGGGGLMVS